MARPTPDTISSGMQAWDASVQANFDLLFATPAPLAVYANHGALPTASSYAHCVAVLEDEDRMVLSDGSVWLRVPSTAAARADSTATTVADLKTDFNDLLAKLRTAKVLAT